MNDYQYDNQTVKGFIISSIFWGVVGIWAVKSGQYDDMKGPKYRMLDDNENDNGQR